MFSLLLKDLISDFYYSIETALPQASMPTIYKQHLYNMTTYTLKYEPGLGKTLFPVLGDNRTLRMRQPDH